MAKYRLIFTESYNRRAAKFLKKHRELIGQYEKALQLLEWNPHHPSLRLHSISINISYRITLELLIRDNTIIPVDVGQHEHVY